MLLKDKNIEIFNMAVSGSAAVVVWILNTRNLKKKHSDFASSKFELKIVPSFQVKYSIPIKFK